MGLVISGLQRARVLAALQVFPDSWKHVFTPHRHQVGSGCSLPPPILWRPAEVNREQATSQPPSQGMAHSPRTSGLCAVSLPDAGQPQPEGVCTCVLVRYSSQRKPGLLGGQPPVHSCVLTSHKWAGVYGTLASGHSSRQVDSRDWLVLWPPDSLPLWRVGVCDGGGGSSAVL